MSFCGKLLPLAKNGKSRGGCKLPLGHGGAHGGSKRCPHCGIKLNIRNCAPSSNFNSRCKSCSATYQRNKLGYNPRNMQNEGGKHAFPCGCSGILPKSLGQSNRFAISSGESFSCRISYILNSSKQMALARRYTPISGNTPHTIIRKMMEEANCERCGEPLKWELGVGKTPHLHHNHDTGEIYGFTHPVCNPRALEQEIENLKEELRRCKGGLSLHK